MQDQQLSTPELAVRCEELIPVLAEAYPQIDAEDQFPVEQLYSMLREAKRFEEEKFIVLAAALGLSDWRCLTRRNHVTQYALSPKRKNACITLIRLISQGRFPAPDVDVEKTCLLEHLVALDVREALPSELASFSFKKRSWQQIAEALCPAGLCVRRGDGYYLLRPSTEEMLRRCEGRRRRLRDGLADLWHPDYGGPHWRRSVSDVIRDMKKRMKNAPTQEVYLDCDLDWQSELAAGGDAYAYLEMLVFLPACRQTVAFVVAQHEMRSPKEFASPFNLPYHDWLNDWNDKNIALVARLVDLLRDRDTTFEEAAHVIDEIVGLTIENVKAVDDVLERARHAEPRFGVGDYRTRRRVH
jgi:hypothetical protein